MVVVHDPILADVVACYDGSNGEATIALFNKLSAHGIAGAVAIELFRAQKASERAKAYRGGNGQGSYRQMAYERKQWAMDNLARVLTAHGDRLGIRWGWATDPEQPFHSALLYVDLPTGQVSWHTTARGLGPDYPGHWDEVRGEGGLRICRWLADVLEGRA